MRATVMFGARRRSYRKRPRRPHHSRQNALAKTLREIGRLERTLFTLDWISDPALRRRSNAGLNKGEATQRTGQGGVLSSRNP